MTLSFHKITFTVDDVLDILSDYTKPDEAPSEPFTAEDIEARFLAEAERLSHANLDHYDGEFDTPSNL